MEADQVTGGSLDYVFVRAKGYRAGEAYPLIVLLHGFGASMYDLADLSPAIDAEGYLYAFPNAPYTVQLGYGQTGYSWRSDRPGVEPPAPGTPTVEQLLNSFFEELLARDGIERGRVVLGGFSQGGGLTLAYGLPRPETFAGLICLSGLLRPAEILNLPTQPSQRIFIAHGVYDQMIDVEVSRKAREFLDEHRYAAEYHEYPMAHQISAEELDDLRPWLHATLPPRATGLM
jgi:phospholipase/carboxylesterase